MNNKPIGVFDSGVGGLTVVSSLMKKMPAEKIIYFGDTARVPYGAKSEESVKRFAEENSNFLISKDVKGIIVACNTATATALPILQDKFSLPIMGVVEPGAKRAVEVTKNGKIGVIGTLRTISSNAYVKAIHSHDKSLSVFPVACPLFVPLIEENWLSHPVTKMVVKEYLQSIVDKGIDTLVLGCTHYPLISEVINECYPDIKLVDSANSTADQINELFVNKGWDAASNGNKVENKGEIELYLSDYSESFKELGERILKQPLGDNLFRVNLEEIAISV